MLRGGVTIIGDKDDTKDPAGADHAVQGACCLEAREEFLDTVCPEWHQDEVHSRVALKVGRAVLLVGVRRGKEEGRRRERKGGGERRRSVGGNV